MNVKNNVVYNCNQYNMYFNMTVTSQEVTGRLGHELQHLVPIPGL